MTTARASGDPEAAEATTDASLAAAASPGAPRHAAPRRRHIRRWVIGIIVVVVLAAATVVGVRRATGPPPTATVTSRLASTRVVPGAAPVLPWPHVGQAAIAIPALGYQMQSGAETPVPVASLTKVMTALVILRDHPLAANEDGPSITMTPTDVSDWASLVHLDESNVQVVAGEVLTERQLLEGLLVHSAGNLGDTLAVWDAGSVAAFVQKMNDTARALGMTSTHYADTTGLSPASTSTAVDTLIAGEVALASPAFTQIVAMSSVTLPVVGPIRSYTPLVGFDGVAGVKSGITNAAGGCDLLLLERSVAGQPVQVLVAVTGQNVGNPLTTAGLVALDVAATVAATVEVVPAVTEGQRIATVAAGGAAVPAVATAPVPALLGVPGQTVHQSFVSTRRLVAGARAGTPVGSAHFVLGDQHQVAQVHLGRTLPMPSEWSRLF